MISQIEKVKNDIFLKTGVKIPYNVIIKDWGVDDDYGRFCLFDKEIHINKYIIKDTKLLTKVIYHEFLHLFLQVDNKFFYDILRDKYLMIYFKYLNKYCSKYQIWSIYPNCDICCEFKQTNTEGLRNQKLLRKDKSISNNYGQFSMLSEFIVHNSDYYFECDFSDVLFNTDLLEMNKFVLNLIKN
jgi:hypothetical protein